MENEKRLDMAVANFKELFTSNDYEIYSAPGRTELIGNHTDHQHGCVITASVNRDILAIVNKSLDNSVNIYSEGFGWLRLSLDELEKKSGEEGTTLSLIRGVLAGLKQKGYEVRGFNAYLTSDIPTGAGLSTSAAFEVLIGTIISGLFHEGKIDPVLIAQIGQYAENEYFGKGSGLMDQMGCEIGGCIYIDFADPKSPVMERIKTDFPASGYDLCLTDTKGSHADLKDEYSMMPNEMYEIAAFFGRKCLRDVSEEDFYRSLPEIHGTLSDRCILRAIHFYNEQKRVAAAKSALEENDFTAFLGILNESGDSSYKYLQNVFSMNDVSHQGVSLGLALSERILKGKGCFRVHGGGLAGTILAFVPNEKTAEYKRELESVFGRGSCGIYAIRPVGGVRLG
ncbi:MAG: galactokinase [Lachnospiraceae bacterium]|jgi:galactokinase|nr:galactokinase [Lachnospiraceae bacterium]